MTDRRPTLGKAYNVTYYAARALTLLRTGPERADAAFRDGQEEAIRHIVEGVLEKQK
jgi:hypothetical protein